MKMRKSILSTAIACVLFAGVTNAAGPQERAMIESVKEQARPMVVEDFSGIYFDAPQMAGFTAMTVNVFGPEGKVMSQRTEGGTLDFLIDGNLPDGDYYYTVTSEVQLGTPVEMHGQMEYSVESRQTGRFIIFNGEITSEEAMRENYRKDLSQDSNTVLQSFASVLDFLIPNAEAVINHNDDVEINSSIAIIGFDDIGDVGSDFEFEANDISDHFRLVDRLGANNIDVIEINGQQGTNNNSLSLVVRNDGDISFANGNVFFDRSNHNVALGAQDYQAHFSIHDTTPDFRLIETDTAAQVEFDLSAQEFHLWGLPTSGSFRRIMSVQTGAPAGSLDIALDGDITGVSAASFGTTVNTSGTILKLGNAGSSRAQMEFHSDDGQAFIEWGQFANKLQFEGPSTNTSVEFDLSSPVNSMVLNSAGFLGMGTNNPASKLEIRATDGTAKFLVVDTLPQLANTMFELRANGGVKFGLTNTAVAKAWTFTNSGSEFRVTQTGTPIEARFIEGGNLIITGTLTEGSDREAKMNIRDIDNSSILAKVRELPIHKWQYKAYEGVDHIGPMAQDFHSTFKIGATDKGISSLDSGGVALAAIQELAEQNDELKATNEALMSQYREVLTALHSQQEELTALRSQEDKLKQLEARLDRLAAESQPDSLMTSR